MKHQLKNVLVLLVGLIVSACNGSNSGEDTLTGSNGIVASDTAGYNLNANIMLPEWAQNWPTPLSVIVNIKGAGEKVVSSSESEAVTFDALSSDRYPWIVHIAQGDTASPLILATAQGNVWVASDTTITVDGDAFDELPDDDNDGFSNLYEVSNQQNTDIQDPTTLVYEFRLPEYLQYMVDEGKIYMQAWIGSLGDLYVADFQYDEATDTHTVIRLGMEPGVESRLMGIALRVAKDHPHRLSDVNAAPGMVVAQAFEWQQIHSGSNNVRFSGDDFGADFDHDYDGLTNAIEVLHGTDVLTNHPDMYVPIINGSTSPVIDGNLGSREWRDWQSLYERGSSTVNGSFGSTVVAANALVGNPGSPESLHRYQVMHDFQNLYIAVRVADRQTIADSGDQWWHDDSVEIYIDGNNTRGVTYDGYNDLAIGLRLGNGDQLSLYLQGNSAPLPEGIVYAAKRFGDQMIYELSLPLYALEMVPGEAFGMDIQINSDTDGGERETKVNWFGPEGYDFAPQNPSYFGDFQLVR